MYNETRFCSLCAQNNPKQIEMPSKAIDQFDEGQLKGTSSKDNKYKFDFS